MFQKVCNSGVTDSRDCWADQLCNLTRLLPLTEKERAKSKSSTQDRSRRGSDGQKVERENTVKEVCTGCG